MAKYKYAVIDIETTGLDRFTDKINYVGIGLAEDIGEPLSKYYILNMYENKDIEKLDKIISLLKKHKVQLIYQNGKFDTLFMAEHYGVMLPIHHDVMLLGTAYDLAAKHSLDAMAEAYLGVPTWDIPLREKKKPNNPIVEAYLKKDLKYPWQLFCYFYNKLSDLQWKHYNLLLKPAFLMYRRSEKRGIYFDRKKCDKVRKAYAAKEKEKLDELNKLHAINWNSPKQVSDALFSGSDKADRMPVLKVSKKTGEPSADAKVLKRLAAKGYDLPTKLLEYKFYYGARTKFLDKWPKHAAHDGRIHPGFNITNVVTGRPSCSNPNLQQVPRNPELRTQFTAGPGRVLLECDYSQIELRIAADYAGDRTMKQIYKTGGDIHTATAIDLSGSKTPTKDERTKAKPVNFGFLYGMMARGFVDYAFDNYGVVFTLQEAERYRQIFFSKYGSLLNWHREVEQWCESMGGVSNRFGRFRSLPDIYSNNKWERGDAVRRAINTPVQSTASDLLVFSAIQCDHELRQSADIWVVGTVHDAILLDCPEDAVEDAKADIKRIMESPKALEVFDVSFDVPIEVDISVGAWGSK